MSALVMVIGIPGSGKTTTSRVLEERLGDCDAHSNYSVRREMGARKYSRSHANIVYDTILQRTEQSLELGRTAIIDSPLALRWTRTSKFIGLPARDCPHCL